MDKIVIFWFRRDLRLYDNAGLSKALSSGYKVLPIFIFDPEILNQFEDKEDRRVDYIHQALHHINQELQKVGSAVITYYNNPEKAFNDIVQKYDVAAVFCNNDYEPSAIARDKSIEEFLNSKSISFSSSKDQVIFEKDDVLKADNTPYTVFTPYSKKWKSLLTEDHYSPYEVNINQFFKIKSSKILDLKTIGFAKSDLTFVEPSLDSSIISNYDKTRDYPGINGTSGISLALRFGTISIRECVKTAIKNNETWLNELIWREFYMQILFHFPQVVHQSFKIKYDKMDWINNEVDFAHWCNGTTGYPIVDAGMRQLNLTGHLHNRVRMIVASFLTKHLLIDWRWGDAYFAQKLLDYDLAANNGNWQWAASCGCDAVPYFRIFNPTEQAKKFDKDLKYIKKWVNNIESFSYPSPIVDHRYARERAIARYKDIQ